MSVDNAKRSRGSEVISEQMQHMFTLKALVEQTSETLKESFMIIDTCAKRKAALVTSLANATDDNVKAQYTRLIQESDVALETRQCVIDELRKMYDFTKDVTASPVGEFPAHFEEPASSIAKDASSFIAMHRTRKFFMANVATTDKGVPEQEHVSSGSITIGDSTLRLAPFEVYHLFRILVGPLKIMRNLKDERATEIIEYVKMFMQKKVLRGHSEMLQRVMTRLLHIILPRPGEPCDLSDGVYLARTKATHVDATKAIEGLFGYYNSFATHKHANYIECRRNNIALDLNKIASGGSISHSNKYRHCVTSSEYHIDISEIEQDSEMTYDILRACQSLGKSSMLVRVARCPGSTMKGTYLCVSFEEHRNVLTETDPVQRATLYTTFKAHAFAVYLTVKNYCVVSSGMRAAVQHAMMHNILDVSADTYYQNYMPCGIEYGVENLTNAAIMYLYTHYQAQLTVVPLPPCPPCVLPTFPTVPFSTALHQAVDQKNACKQRNKKHPKAAAHVERMYTVEMHERIRRHLESTLAQDVFEKVSAHYKFPVDDDGDPVFYEYDAISDDDGLIVYKIFFPPQMELESDDEDTM